MKTILYIASFFSFLSLVPIVHAQKARIYTDTYDTFHITTAGVTQLVNGTAYPVNIILTVNSVGGTGSSVIVKNKSSPQVILARKSPLAVGTWPLLALCEGVIAENGIEVEVLGNPAPNVDILITYAK